MTLFLLLLNFILGHALTKAVFCDLLNVRRPITETANWVLTETLHEMIHLDAIAPCLHGLIVKQDELVFVPALH